MINGPNGPVYDPHVEPSTGFIIFLGVIAIVFYAAIAWSIWETIQTARRRRHPQAKLIIVLAFLPLVSFVLHGTLATVTFFGPLILLPIWANTPGLLKRRRSLRRT